MWMMIQRHAESDWNARMAGKKAHGKDDAYYASLTDATVPLSQDGVEQAERSAEFLQRLFGMYEQNGPVKAYCTPMQRGEETAEIQIAGVGNVEWLPSKQRRHPYVEADIRLTERDFGEWSGMTADEVTEKYARRAELMRKLAENMGMTQKEAQEMHDKEMEPLNNFIKLKNDKKTGGVHAWPVGGETVAQVMYRTKSFGGTIARQTGRGLERFFVETSGIVSQVLPITFMRKDPYLSFCEEINPSNTAIRLITNNLKGSGYKDHGYIYDPKNGIDCTKNPIKGLEKYLR